MKRAGRGRILLISSVTGTLPSLPHSAVYAATKAYQLSLGRALGRELEPHGVAVTVSCPGAVRDTSFS
eukprot:CAMPEP_0194295084 /NCGR_PEP_ID=MMETSP0169-20130528/52575_1 /TAXON_ID=218684 /ORGANISM="Corethron pennatum, Strain L29A3" /LENGTH=67 /DNA_ID=CAMNT_0039044183 /DNA_START=9 /DNA_END=208 /DNA_ORIENTATION=+